jgi:hypothetical protein
VLLSFVLVFSCLLAVIPRSGVWLPFHTSFWMMTETAWHIVHDAAKVLHSNFLLTEAGGISCIILQPAILKTSYCSCDDGVVPVIFMKQQNSKQPPVRWRIAKVSANPFNLGSFQVFSTCVFTFVLSRADCRNFQVLFLCLSMH